ncbi:lysophospholipid acyltransferase family protein [Pseudolysinimonas sp.]|uniref:lysophospholipid acyltransferase family protein n=1 Tax=Pseudolysinimonas sp. TaxID=2680009 RepID=UPI003F7EA98D
MFYAFLKNVAIGPWVRALWQVWQKGLDNIPRHGGVIIASNHLSFLDPVFLPLMLRRPISFLAKSEYFTGRGLKGWLVRRFFFAVKQLPMDRSGGQASSSSLGAGLEHLAKGGQLGIYPEGTRSLDGRLYKGRTGVARMVLQAEVPVVPIAMVGTFEVMPSGAKLPRRRKVGMIAGEPLDFSRFYGRQNDGDVLRQITDEIMQAIQKLSGQEYVDEYAPRRVTSGAARGQSPRPPRRA